MYVSFCFGILHAMEFLRKLRRGDAKREQSQRPEGAGETPSSQLSEKKSQATLLKERIPLLSVVPDENEWTTISIKERGRDVSLKVPFVASEIEAIDEAYDSWVKLYTRGALNSGSEREFSTQAQMFPRKVLDEMTHKSVPTLDDRARSVKGIILSAIAAREILERYPAGVNRVFSPSEDSREDLERIALLPEQMIEHASESVNSSLPKTLYEKGRE